MISPRITMDKIKFIISGLVMFTIASLGHSQEWDSFPVPASPGQGMVWELQENVSDDFNYEFSGESNAATIGDKWTNFYHNSWSGPLPTVWKRDHVSVADGKMKIRSSRQPGDSVNISGKNYAVTNLGCATSTQRVQYPVYIETYAKIMKSVLASGVWLLSADDTQEIDISEAYGGDRWNNPWFSNMRLHLSHHVFIRQPFTDWQPNDEGSFYTDGKTVWSDDYHRLGVYWRDPWHLEYYVNGKLVRVRSGKDQIDPVYHTNSVNPGDVNNDTRTGLSKPMDIIVDTEDQTWRATQGLSPTDEELANVEDNTYNVDWIRVYKPIQGEVEPVSAIALDKTEVETFIGDEFTLIATITPNNANDLSVVWASEDSTIASVDSMGKVTCHTEGTTNISVTTNENNLTAVCQVSISGEAVAPSLEFDDESKYLNAEFMVNGALKVEASYHAGSGNTVENGVFGGVKFWLREILPGWSVANDYVAIDTSAIGKESGMASATISLENVPATSEIPSENWYFLYMTFQTSEGQTIDKGIFPINILRSTGVQSYDPAVFNLFPNPGRDKLNLSGSAVEEATSLNIYSVSGQLIKTISRPAQNKTLVLDIQDIKSGRYILELVADKTYTSVFIKG